MYFEECIFSSVTHIFQHNVFIFPGVLSSLTFSHITWPFWEPGFVFRDSFGFCMRKARNEVKILQAESSSCILYYYFHHYKWNLKVIFEQKRLVCLFGASPNIKHNKPNKKRTLDNRFARDGLHSVQLTSLNDDQPGQQHDRLNHNTAQRCHCLCRPLSAVPVVGLLTGSGNTNLYLDWLDLLADIYDFLLAWDYEYELWIT